MNFQLYIIIYCILTYTAMIIALRMLVRAFNNKCIYIEAYFPLIGFIFIFSPFTSILFFIISILFIIGSMITWGVND